jgi:AsmA protein
MIAAIAALCAFVASALVSWPVMSPALRATLTASIKAQLASQYGADIAFRVRRISLLPRPQAQLISLAYRDSTGDFEIGAPRATVSIQPLALLAGRVSLGNIILDTATLKVRSDAGTDRATMDRLASLLDQLADKPETPSIEIRDGRIETRDRQNTTRVRQSLEAANLVMRAGRGSRDALIEGTSRWQGQDLKLLLRWPGQTQGDAQKQNKLEFGLRSSLFSARFAGPLVNAHGQPGLLDFETTDFARFMSLLGETGPLRAIAQNLKLRAATATKTGKDGALDIAMTSVSATLDSQPLEGALAIQPSGNRSVVSGTLAGKMLDLGRIAARLNPGRIEDLAENSGRLLEPAYMVGSRDLDLRLSLDNAQLGPVQLEKTAMQIIVNPSRIDLNLLQAQGYKGQVKARISATTSASEPDIRAVIGIEKIDLGSINQDILGSRRITGTASGQLVLEGIGRNTTSVLASAAGRANITIRQGDLNGFSLAETVRRAEGQPLALLRDWRTGRSTFDTAQFTGIISHGIMDLTEGSITAPTYRLGILGTIGLRDQQITLGGTLSGNGTSTTMIPFSIKGPWSAPVIGTDIGSIIRKSGTAAP